MVYKMNGVPKEAKAVKYPKPRSADGKIDSVKERSENLQLTKEFLIVTESELIQLARELGGKKAGLQNRVEGRKDQVGGDDRDD